MAAGLGAKTLQEYLVSLGVKLDEKGMTKMEGFLKGSKMGFLALTGIMVTAATVATKWVKQINETELAYAKQAKTQHKSIETIRASENALKAMGKTKQEIAKDKSLKIVYDDLVKMNKAMALPDGSRGLSFVRSIRDEFLKFKSTVQYAMQWVNYHIISKLEGPLTRIRDTMKTWREKLTAEMPLWTSKIADGIAVFIRLLETAVRFGGEVIKFIQRLPDEVKIMGGAVIGLWKIIRAGPLGWLLGGLTALLLLLDDFYAFKSGEKSALSGLWEGLEDGTVGEKLSIAVENGINELTKWIGEHEEEIAGVGKILGDIIAGALDIAGMLVGALGNTKVLAAAYRLGDEILKGIERGVNNLGNKIFGAIMDMLPENVQNTLGWEKGKGWKIPEPESEKDAFVGDTDKDWATTVHQGDIVAADKKYAGVAYRNVDGNLIPEYAPEYARFMDENNIPKVVNDSLAAALQQYQSGGNPFLPSKGEPYQYLDDGGLTPEVRAVQKELFAALKNGTIGNYSMIPGVAGLADVYSTEKAALDNGESYQALFEERVQAALDGMTLDPSGWYSKYKNGDLFTPFTPDYDYYGRWDMWQKGLTEEGVAKEAQIQYDPNQVTQATKEANDIAQGAVNPIYIPLIPTYGEDGDVEIRYDQHQDKTHNALGGRYDKPTETTLVEQGEPEYVIPIKKLGRAIPLIRMMLSEIGEKGRQMLSDFGITPDTDVNALVASKGLGMPGGGSPVINIVNNYTSTVNAPATFNINGSGNDPQAIGQAAYSAQERFLVRTLKAVVQSE